MTYTYNANGIRTGKTVNGVEHIYMLDGSKILREIWGTNELMPIYDNEESVSGIIYNGTSYYFQKNLQGDVIELVDEEAEVVARYTYDAWGKVTGVKDKSGNAITDATHVANINPFRYRGYYFDGEIGLYYVQSRYYNPEMSRWVNGDELATVCNQGLRFSFNVFTYCENSPIVEWDFDGRAIVGAVIKFFLYALWGAVAQAISDTIQFLFGKYILGKDQDFEWSPTGDYVSSAISWGMTSLNLFNTKLACFLAPFIPVVAKYLINIFWGKFSWKNFFVDFLAACVAGIVSVALNNTMKRKLKQCQSVSKKKRYRLRLCGNKRK